MNGARFSAFSHVSGLPDLWFDLLKKICSTSCLVSCLTLIFLVAFFFYATFAVWQKKAEFKGSRVRSGRVKMQVSLALQLCSASFLRGVTATKQFELFPL